MWLWRLLEHRVQVEPEDRVGCGFTKKGTERTEPKIWHEHLQLSAVGSLNWNMALSKTTGKSPPSVGVDLWVRIWLWVRKCPITVCMCSCERTCRAPFLLKEDTHCIRRHISSATDSTIFDKIRGTRSLETVKTWDRKVDNEEKGRKDTRSVWKRCGGCLYLSVNCDNVDQSFL